MRFVKPQEVSKYSRIRRRGAKTASLILLSNTCFPPQEQSRGFAKQGARFRYRADGGIYVAAGWHIPVVETWEGSHPVPRGEENPTIRCDDPVDTALDWLRVSFTLGELTQEEASALGNFLVVTFLMEIERFNRS